MERALLGALISDGESYVVISNKVKPESFYIPNHRTVFEAIRMIYMRKAPIDIVTIGDQLKRSGMFDKVGGLVFLSDLATEFPTSANIEHYADVVSEYSRTRSTVAEIAKAIDVAYDQTKNQKDLISSLATALSVAQEGKQERDHKDSTQVANETLGLVEKIKKRGEQGSPIRSHLKDVDGIIDEYAPGELIVIAGRPSHGKTAYAMQSAYDTAETGERVAVISIEMPNTELMLRRVSHKSGIPLHVIRGPHKLSMNQMSHVNSALASLAELPIVYDDNTYQDISDLEAKMEFLKLKYDPKMYVIDYLQLIGSRSTRKNQNQITSDNSAFFKNFAKRHGVSVVLLSQLNRDVDKRPDKRPTLSDLRDSGSIEQDADKVIFVYRPAAYRGSSRPKDFVVHGKKITDMDNYAEIIIAKNRQGATGSALVGFKGNTVSFYDVETEEPEGPAF